MHKLAMATLCAFGALFVTAATLGDSQRVLEDHGFIIGADPAHHPVRWDPKDAPILILVHPAAAMWQLNVIRAATHWNAVLGFELFRVADDLRPEAAAFVDAGPGVVPVLGFAPDEGCPRPMAHCNPHTEVSAAVLDGRITAAPIYMPLYAPLAAHPRAWWGVVHELGHVLGLDHDELHPDGTEPWSIMEPNLDLSKTDMPPITGADQLRIRRWYVEHKDL